MLAYEIGDCTSVGQVRRNNEDSLMVAEVGDGWLVAVADGVGGSQGGQQASATVVQTLERLAPVWPGGDLEGQTRALSWAVDDCQRALGQAAQGDTGLRHMATTLVAALLLPQGVVHLYAGDSRLYWFRQGTVRYVTRDHNRAADLQAQGVLSQEEAQAHPFARQLTSWLGPEGEPDQLGPVQAKRQLAVKPGDLLLLCSDGLYSELASDQLLELVSRQLSVQGLAQLLVKEACNAGGRDNITVIVVRVAPRRT